jgi:hypothetical protein
MKRVILFFVALMIFSFVANAQDISGTWKHSVLGNIQIIQNGRSVYFETGNRATNFHEAGGTIWNGTTVYLIYGRQIKGCASRLAVTWTIESKYVINEKWESLDNACGLKKGQTGKGTLYKQ